MAQLEKAQKNRLKALMGELKRLQKKMQALHRKTGYEDLSHGLLALEITGHAVEEALEHTGLGGEIQRRRNPKAHRQAKQWQKIVKGIRNRGGKFLKNHPSEDLETALKVEIAEGSLEEVAKHYE